MRLLVIVLITALISSVATIYVFKPNFFLRFTHAISNEKPEGPPSQASGLVRSQSSKTLSIQTVDPETDFLVIEGEQRVALIVANEYGYFPDNNGENPQSVYLGDAPKNDVTLIRDALERIGFKVEVAFNLDASALRTEIRDFKLEASQSQDAVIYYTGTGVEIDGVNFYPTVTASGLLTADERPNWITAEDLGNAVKSARQNGIVMLDGGRPVLTVPESMKVEFLRGETEIGLKSINRYSNVAFVYSSESGQPAFESQFASFFAESMAATIAQPNTSIRDVVQTVRLEVEAKTNGKQSPVLYIQDTIDFELHPLDSLKGANQKPEKTRSLTAENQVFSLSEQPRIALIIGVADYNGDGDLDDGRSSLAVLEQGYAPDLANPLTDAEDIAARLDTIGFKTFSVSNPNQTELENALFEFGEEIERSGPDAISVVYFAGHAIQVSGTNYLVPQEAKIPKIDFDRWPQARIERHLSNFATPINLLYERFLEPSEIGINLIILDACRNNPWERRASGRSVGDRGGRGLADIPFRLRRSVVAFATAPGTEAADGDPDERNSPYTGVLKQHIASENLSIRDLFDVVGVGVEEATSKQQTPFLSSPPIGDACLGACVLSVGR